MSLLNRLIPALAAAPLTVFGAVARAAAPSQPSGFPTPGAPTASDFGALFNEAFFLKLGFSFMVGMAVGYALKVAFKVALVLVGVILLGIFGLQYAGVAHVDWTGVEVQYDTWAAWLSAHGGAFLDFIGNNLSNSVSFLAGLGLGLKL